MTIHTLQNDEPVQSFRVMENFTDHHQALELLQRIASQVKPIMKKRGWRVGCLAEFYPPKRDLLGRNFNRGQLISIRLRIPNNQCQFINFYELVGTMLHELTHIECGPHDSVFYRKLDELQTECEALIFQGYTGEGFYGNGQTLGQGVPATQPSSASHDQMRQKMREAAERRCTATAGGQRLGGKDGLQNLSRNELTAGAAERRQAESNRQDTSIGSRVPTGGSSSSSSSSNSSWGSSSSTRRDASGRLSSTDGPLSSSSSAVPTDTEQSAVEWTCPRCTLINQPDHNQCAACDRNRPASGRKRRKWSCPRCTYMNDADVVMCLVCDYC